MSGVIQKIDKWSFRQKIVSTPLIIISLTFLGYFMLLLVYKIPEKYMIDNMRDSSYVFEAEGTYPKLMMSENSKLDNSTDALMLLTASNPKVENVWKSAVNVAAYKMDGRSRSETLLYVYHEGGENAEIKSYARYWHGYLVFLKPLLAFFNYGTIRHILMVVQLLLFSLLIVKLRGIQKN